MRDVYERLNQVVVPRPNWATPVKETLEYRTEVFQAENGLEERHSFRMMPRWSTQYRSDSIDEAARAIWTDLVNPRVDRSFVVPIRWRSLRVQTVTDASNVTLDGELPWWFQPGITLVFETATQQEHAQLSSASPVTGSITLVGPLTATLSPGDKVMLGLKSFYEQENSFTSQIRRHRGFSPTFLADPGTMPILQPPTSGYETHVGHVIYPPKHNWSATLDMGFDDRRETVDFDRGVIEHTWNRRHDIITEDRRYTAMNPGQAAQLVQEFMRQRGMRKPFWTHLLSRDFPPTAYNSSVNRNIYFDQDLDNVIELYEGHPVLSHVWVQWPDGAYQINKIINYNVSNRSNQFMICENAWKRPISPDGQVYWAALARFGTDRLEMNWQTDSVVSAQLPIRALHTGFLPENDIEDNLKWL